MDSSGNTINEKNKATYEPPTIERVSPPADLTRDDVDEDFPQAPASPVPREPNTEREQQNEERVQLLPDNVEQYDETNNLLLLFKGEFQPPAYRDAWCAVLFVTQLMAVLVTATVYGPAAFDSTTAYHNNTTNTTTTITTAVTDFYLGDDNNDNNNSNNNNEEKDESFVALDMLYVLLATSGFFVAATMATTACLRVMTLYPTHVVKVSFFTAPLTLGAVAILATIAASTTASSDDDDDDNDDVVVSLYLWLVVAIFSALSICWYKCFQRFIPFAASTLRTALTAIRGQGLGLYALEMALLLGLYAYTAIWLVAVGGVYAHGLQQMGPSCYQDDNGSGSSDDDDNDDMCDNVPMNMPVAFFLLLSLYWTQQVVQNLVHTTTSGTVGTWWFSPLQEEENASSSRYCCGTAVTDSFYRASTYSFGSICFGSLLVSIVQVLERLARQNRRSHRRSGGASTLVACIVECLLLCLRSWLEYFNSWAFCYVGLYGYSYLDAGRNVVRLFSERGWTVFISDRLVFRVLFMANLGVGALTGLLCMLVGWIVLMIAPGHVNMGALHGLFWIGFIIGLYVSGTLLFVVESATRTAMILFAESAAEFAQVHEELHQDLKDGWSKSYPDEYAQAVAIAEARPVI